MSLRWVVGTPPKYLAIAFLVLFTGYLFANDGVPLEHFTIDSPVELTPQEADDVYQELLPQIQNSMALVEHHFASNYLSWRKFNKYPYLSEQHGNRYLNNYGNDVARGYLELAKGEEMPDGSILVKDSFTVESKSSIYPGALFIMQKLAKGQSKTTANWRYLMVLPDGSTLGDSSGVNAELMGFCHTCHEKVSDYDYLFMLPADAM